MQFWPPDDEHMCLKHVEAWNKHIVKQNFCAWSWLITKINNTEMHGQQNVKKKCVRVVALHWNVFITNICQKSEWTPYNLEFNKWRIRYIFPNCLCRW